MQSQVENSGDLERRIRIAIPRAKIESEVESRLKRIAKTVKLHGFRPGKVPMKLVAQQYGGQVRQEVISEAGSEQINNTLREQQIRIAGQPRIEPVSEGVSADQLEFNAVFEVYPDVVVGNLAERTIERPLVQVTEQDVDNTIETLRKQRATFAPVTRPAQLGDQVDIDYLGKIGGEPFAGGESKGFVVVLGQGRTLKDFDDGILGMQPGESKSFDMTFPENYQGKEVAGKTATFEVKLNQVMEPQLPEVGADFAKNLGIEDGDVTKMRAEVRSNIEREVEKRIENKVREQVMQGLSEATPITLPKALVLAEIERLAQQMRQEMQAHGIQGADAPMPNEFFEEKAKSRVSLGLILAEIIKTNGLKADPAQVRKLVESYAESYEHPEQVIAWYYENPARLTEVENLALEQNVVSWAMNQMKVEDKPLSFDELMGRTK